MNSQGIPENTDLVSQVSGTQAPQCSTVSGATDLRMQVRDFSTFGSRIGIKYRFVFTVIADHTFSRSSKWYKPKIVRRCDMLFQRKRYGLYVGLIALALMVILWLGVGF